MEAREKIETKRSSANAMDTKIIVREQNESQNEAIGLSIIEWVTGDPRIINSQMMRHYQMLIRLKLIKVIFSDFTAVNFELLEI